MPKRPVELSLAQDKRGWHLKLAKPLMDFGHTEASEIERAVGINSGCVWRRVGLEWRPSRDVELSQVQIKSIVKDLKAAVAGFVHPVVIDSPLPPKPAVAKKAPKEPWGTPETDARMTREALVRSIGTIDTKLRHGQITYKDAALALAPRLAEVGDPKAPVDWQTMYICMKDALS